MAEVASTNIKQFPDADMGDNDDVHREALERFDESYTYEQDNRERSSEDVRFLDGDQWKEKDRYEREQDRRPCLTFNHLPQYVDMTVGDYRQNEASLKVKPLGGIPYSNPKPFKATGGKEYTATEVYEGLVRHIQRSSRANQIYESCLEQSAGSGFGHFRVMTEYVTDDVFEQRIILKRIRNQFSVYDDPQADEADKSDRSYCFVTTELTEGQFKRKYPNAVPVDFDTASTEDGLKHWYFNNTVVVAEYYRRVPVTKEIALLSDRRVVEMDDDFRAIRDELEEQGVVVLKTRKVKTLQVEWRVMTGMETLEGPKVIPGRYIPIVSVLGKELYVEGHAIYRGLIRHAKDAQRMYNYERSSYTERTALAPKSPYIAGITQVEGFEEIWRSANNRNHAFLPYNDRDNPNPPRREQPPNVSPAEFQLSIQAKDDIQATIGKYQPSLGAPSNETSGRAIVARQRQGDAMSFPYIDNLVRAIEQAGRIIIDMIPHIYDTNRIIQIINADDTEDSVEIHQVVKDEETGKEITVNDLSIGKYDIVSSVGPSYATQRMEAADSMTNFVQAVPRAGEVIPDLIAENMDWPGADKIAERLRKVLPPGLVETREGEEPPQPPPPTPQDQAKTAEAEADMAMAEAKKMEAQAKMAEAQNRMVELEGNASIGRLMESTGQTPEQTRGAKGAPVLTEDAVQRIVAQTVASIIESQGPRS